MCPKNRSRSWVPAFAGMTIWRIGNAMFAMRIVPGSFLPLGGRLKAGHGEVG
jgi:hypothetical protein